MACCWLWQACNCNCDCLVHPHGCLKEQLLQGNAQHCPSHRLHIMKVVPAQFGKSWQIVCRQSSGNSFAGALAGNECWQSTAIRLPATSGILWQVYSLPIFTVLFAGKTRFATNHDIEGGGKVVGKCLAVLFCTGIARKVLVNLPPELSVKLHQRHVDFCDKFEAAETHGQQFVSIKCDQIHSKFTS